MLQVKRKGILLLTLFLSWPIFASEALPPQEVVDQVFKALARRDMWVYYQNLTLASRKKLYQSLMFKVYQMQKGSEDPETRQRMEDLLVLPEEEFFRRAGSILPAFYIQVYKKTRVVRVSVSGRNAQVVFQVGSRFFPMSLILEEDRWRIVHIE